MIIAKEKSYTNYVYKIAIFGYLMFVYLYSYHKNFQFFIDSGTYLNEYPGYYFYLVNKLFPFSSMAIGLIAFIFVYTILSNFELMKFSIFANPYTLLLIFNYTKEQLIFIGVVVALGMIRLISSSNVKKILFFVGSIMLLIRPVYIIVMLTILMYKKIKLNILIPIIFILIILIIVLIYDLSIDLLLNTFFLRNNIDHVGREFFSYLCSLERHAVSDFIICSLPAIYGLPLHNDTFSLSYFLVLLFILPIYMMLFSRRINLNYKIGIFIIFSIFNILIFWWGPTYGAYLRYTVPITWILYFSFFNAANYTSMFKKVKDLQKNKLNSEFASSG